MPPKEQPNRSSERSGQVRHHRVDRDDQVEPGDQARGPQHVGVPVVRVDEAVSQGRVGGGAAL